MDKVTKKTISMPTKDFLAEHKKLAKLSVKRPKLVKAEAKDQGNELKKVKKELKKKYFTK